MRDWEGGVLNKSVIDGAFKTVNIRERQVQNPDPRCSDPTGLYGACEISISNTYPGALSPCGHCQHLSKEGCTGEHHYESRLWIFSGEYCCEQ